MPIVTRLDLLCAPGCCARAPSTKCAPGRPHLRRQGRVLPGQLASWSQKALPRSVVCLDDVPRPGPADAQHMSGPTESLYDVIVIGTGPIGRTVADRARAAGLSVAAVERELVGGECSYWACIPSKAMLRPGRRGRRRPPGRGGARCSSQYRACWTSRGAFRCRCASTDRSPRRANAISRTPCLPGARWASAPARPDRARARERRARSSGQFPRRLQVKSTLRLIRVTTSAIPSPVRQLVKTNGLSS